MRRRLLPLLLALLFFANLAVLAAPPRPAQADQPGLLYPIVFVPGTAGTYLESPNNHSDPYWISMQAILGNTNALPSFLSGCSLGQTGVLAFFADLAAVGTAGLTCIAGDIWNADPGSIGVPASQADVSQLRLEPDGSDPPGMSVHVGLPIANVYVSGESGTPAPGGEVYARLLQWMNQYVQARADSKWLYLTGYDWRKSPTYNADHYVLPQVQLALKTTGASKVILISHSLGALVARTFIATRYARLNGAYGGSVVAGQVAFGGPYLGTPRVAQAISSIGWGFGIPFMSYAWGPILAPDWPSVYDMMPMNDPYFQLYPGGFYYKGSDRNGAWDEPTTLQWLDGKNAQLEARAQAWWQRVMDGSSHGVPNVLIAGLVKPMTDIEAIPLDQFEQEEELGHSGGVTDTLVRLQRIQKTRGERDYALVSAGDDTVPLGSALLGNVPGWPCQTSQPCGVSTPAQVPSSPIGPFIYYLATGTQAEHTALPDDPDLLKTGILQAIVDGLELPQPVQGSLSPGTMYPGGSVTVNGQAQPYSEVDVKIDGTIVGSGRSDEQGNYTVPFTAPSDAYAGTELPVSVGCDACGNQWTTIGDLQGEDVIRGHIQNFQAGVKTTPGDAPSGTTLVPGQKIWVIINGLASQYPIYLCPGSCPAQSDVKNARPLLVANATQQSDGSYSFDQSLTVPSDWPLGENTIVIQCPDPDCDPGQATFPFTLIPQNGQLQPTRVNPGEPVTITGQTVPDQQVQVKLRCLAAPADNDPCASFGAVYPPSVASYCEGDAGATPCLEPITAAADGSFSAVLETTAAPPGPAVVSFSCVTSQGVSCGPTQTLDLTIAGPLALNESANLAPAEVGFPYQYPLHLNGGIAPYTWSVPAGDLPPGFMLDAGTGFLHGTPTAAGSFTFPVTVTDSSNPVETATGNLTLVVSQPPVPAVTKVSPEGGATSGGTSVTITGTGFRGATAVDFGSTAAPSFAVGADDTSITATAPAGSGTVDITVTTPGGTSTTAQADQFTYVPPLTITTSSLPDATAGQSYSATLQASGGLPKLTWAVVQQCLKDCNEGSGTGPAAGHGSERGGTAPALGSFIRSPWPGPDRPASDRLPDPVARGGRGVAAAPGRLGGRGGSVSPVMSDALPSWLTLDPQNGTLSGTPPQAGSLQLEIQVTDSLGEQAEQLLPLTIQAPSGSQTTQTPSQPPSQTTTQPAQQPSQPPQTTTQPSQTAPSSSPPPYSGTPTGSFDPTAVAPGQSVTLSGTAKPGSFMSVYLYCTGCDPMGVHVGVAQVAGDATYSLTFTVPSSAEPGAASVSAGCDRCGNGWTTFDLTLTGGGSSTTTNTTSAGNSGNSGATGNGGGVPVPPGSGGGGVEVPEDNAVSGSSPAQGSSGPGGGGGGQSGGQGSGTPQPQTQPAPTNGLPVVTQLTPNSGPDGGDQLVTIGGSNLAGTTSVSFGDFGQAQIVQISPDGTWLQVDTPQAWWGDGPVWVQVFTSQGQSTVTSQDQYTYVSGQASGTSGGSGSASSGQIGSGGGSGQTTPPPGGSGSSGQDVIVNGVDCSSPNVSPFDKQVAGCPNAGGGSGYGGPTYGGSTYGGSTDGSGGGGSQTVAPAGSGGQSGQDVIVNGVDCSSPSVSPFDKQVAGCPNAGAGYTPPS